MALPKGYIRSNDEVAEPFQPLPTQEKWTKQDLWDNRRGTVIRSGLYLKYRREQSIEIDIIRESIKTEIEERKAADKSLNDRVDKVEEEIANMDDWHEPLAQETAARIAGDKKLTDDLNTEINTRASQTAALQDKIAKEISDRTAADTVLDNRINKEIQDRTDADEVLQSQIDAETQARESADQTLQSNIDAEAVARADGDKKNADAVNALKSSLGTAAFVNTGNQPGNVPVIQDDGVLSSSIIPPVKVNHTWVVDSEAEMLALNAAVGDFAVRTDTSVTYVLKDLPASNIDNWILLSSPTDGVTSWNGQTGAVTYKAPVTSVNGKKDDVVLTINGKTSGSDGNTIITGSDINVSSSNAKTIEAALNDTVTLSTNQTITGNKAFEGNVSSKQQRGNDVQSAYGYGVRQVKSDGTNGQLQYLAWSNPQLSDAETANGFSLGISGGANMIYGAGEAHRVLLKAIQTPETTPPILSGVKANGENAILVADGTSFIGSGYQTGSADPTTGKWWKFGTDGKFLAPNGSEYVTKTDIDLSKYVTLDTAQTITGKKVFTGLTDFKSVVSGNLQVAQRLILADDTGASMQTQGTFYMNPRLTGQTGYGFAVGMGWGGLTIIGGGEAHRGLLDALETPATTPPVLGTINGGTEHAVLVADSNVYIGAGYQSAGATGHWWKFGADGKAYSPAGGNLVDTDTEQTFTASKSWGEIKTTGKGEEGQLTTIAPDGSITQIQKVAGSNEYTEVYIANGHVQARTLLTDGTPQQTAFISGHGLTQTKNIDWTVITERQNGFSGGSIQIKRYNNVVTIIGDNITCPAVAQWGTKTLFNIPAAHVNKKNMYGAVYLSKYTATYHVDSNGQFIVAFPVASTTSMHAGFTLTYVI